MSSFRQKLFLLFVGSMACAPCSLPAQPLAEDRLAIVVKSPIAIFRELLAMSPEQRTKALATSPPEAQKRILQKLGEYQILPGALRERRLKETELRWYLRPLMDVPRGNRAARLAQIPKEERVLVEARLNQWDIIPPPLQQQWKNDERVANYFAQTGSRSTEPPLPITPERNAELQQALAGFNKFFELPPEEQDKTLDSASDVSGDERQQMKQTLDTFGKLTREQREQCIRSFEKFAAMGPEEREQFLKNADEWNKMSPEEQEKWRKLVAIAPIIPPPPPTPPLPSPTSSSRTTQPSVATN